MRSGGWRVALDESLTAGAIGLSINHFDRDRTLRPLPGFFAEDEEFRALLAVVAQHPPATMQVITRFNDREKDVADAERFARLAREAGVRAQWPGIPFNVRDDDHRPTLWEAHHRLQAEGADFWPIVAFKPLAPFFSFERSLVFQRVPVWNDWVNGPEQDKLRLLADPAWRDRARESWDNRTHSSLSRIDRPAEMILSLSETGAGPVDISLERVCRTARSAHLRRAGRVGARQRRSFADGRGPGAAVRNRHRGRTARTEDARQHQRQRRPSPAVRGAGEHIYLLSHYVRDAGLLSIEEAVHALTGRTASFFGLGDRGVVAPGKLGDLVVFALDEIELGRGAAAVRRAARHLAAGPQARGLSRHHLCRCADLARRAGDRRAAGQIHATERLGARAGKEASALSETVNVSDRIADGAVDEYLDRIGLTGPLEPDHRTLALLQQAHLDAVPFENLSIHLGEPIVLTVDALIDKLVRRRRGGFCYELNGAFGALLAALGFRVTLKAARVFDGRAAGGRRSTTSHYASISMSLGWWT